MKLFYFVNNVKITCIFIIKIVYKLNLTIYYILSLDYSLQFYYRLYNIDYGL